MAVHSEGALTMPSPDKGYRLPAIVDPPRLCVLLHIPNDPNHIRAFWGALTELQYWYNWERDAAHTGTLVGQVWQNIIEADYEVWVNSVLNECGEATMDCTDLANCIENDPNFLVTLQQLVDNAVADVTPTPDHPISSARQEQNLFPSESGGCDLDSVFGIVTALVDGLHQECLDFLEIIEALTNPLEIAAEVTDNFSIFSAGASTAFDIAQWLQDNIQENYLAAMTTGVRDEIRCALFCNAKEGCSLSIADIFSTYSALAGAAVQPVVDFDSLVNVLTNLVVETDLETVARFHLFIVMCLMYGSSAIGLENFNGLALIMALGANDSDPDHNILCTTCVDLFWEHDASFGAGLKNWGIQIGTLDGGRIHSAINPGNGNENVIVNLQFPESVKIRAVEMFYQRVNTGAGSGSGSLIRLRPIIGSNTGASTLWASSDPAGSSTIVRCAVRTPIQGTFLAREVHIELSGEGPAGDIYLDRVRVWGETSPTPPNANEVSTQPQCTP